MKKLHLIAPLCGGILLGCVLTAKVIPYFAAQLDKHAHFDTLFFGDSITANAQWGDRLAGSVHASGYPGYTTSHLVELVNQAVLRYHPKTCYLMAGVNDIKVGIPLSRTERNFRALIDTLRAHRVRPVIQSTLYTAYPALNRSVDSLDRFLVALAKENNLTYLDVNRVLAPDHRLNASFTADGLHPNKKGYAAWTVLLKTLN